VLNMVGLTAMNSPASNADYSLSITLLLYAVLIGPAAEELIFRGFVLKGLRPCGRVFSVLISSVLFSLMHGDIQQIYFTFVVGIILGYTASEYSIWASFLLHVFNNGFISMFMTYGLSGLPDFLYYLFTGMMFAACIAVLVIAVISGGVESAEEFFTRDKIEREAVMGLINPWFIVFVIFCAAETLFSLSPLS
ncbi:MAG: CPBP family intramembrane metalloprotease, partial [Eubacteriales bacterium]|nr:CPBP family intramembrane metalloprotease [Eubacteriales bacterium]